ncbi:protein of unknown function [Catalinimonas alkaloidigena]|uniref:DUF4269 domain-containing protein n=1 Tax=Catalinimonas alkaloidigena TaxID=1075417 RepID=A0A1G9BEW5_9BACT|nr:DUF4269 domain-containing protein [Catalinimonas alkaloidigena]SDK38039.1 protein of unknown function [Catalinimonas alkaloidigena]
MNWRDLAYLQAGNVRQQRAYRALTDGDILTALAPFDPVLIGTIPLQIDLPGSDLDLACCFAQDDVFIRHLRAHFQHRPDFELKTKLLRSVPTVLVRFNAQGFLVEIFGQPQPVDAQYGYRHMVVEHRILQDRDEAFRNEIVRLKRTGLSTEAAFAHLLGLSGDPYEALLQWADATC